MSSTFPLLTRSLAMRVVALTLSVASAQTVQSKCTDGTSVGALLSTLTLPDACAAGSHATPLGESVASKPLGHAEKPPNARAHSDTRASSYCSSRSSCFCRPLPATQ